MLITYEFIGKFWNCSRNLPMRQKTSKKAFLTYLDILPKTFKQSIMEHERKINKRIKM